MALVFAERLIDDYRYVAQTGKWMKWQGTRWQTWCAEREIGAVGTKTAFTKALQERGLTYKTTMKGGAFKDLALKPKPQPQADEPPDELPLDSAQQPNQTVDEPDRAASDENAPYQALGFASAGERCAICGDGSPRPSRIRFRGEVSVWHKGCADRYVAAVGNRPRSDDLSDIDF